MKCSCVGFSSFVLAQIMLLCCIPSKGEAADAVDETGHVYAGIAELSIQRDWSQSDP